MSKIKKSNDEIIVIYRDVNKTIAMNKVTGEKAAQKMNLISVLVQSWHLTGFLVLRTMMRRNTKL